MTMIEQVARAISETRDLCWDQYSPELKATYKAMARAAIAAMHEPSEAMLDAGYDAGFNGTTESDTVDIWDRMIHAALAEEPK
jgi:hypothetical protein